MSQKDMLLAAIISLCLWLTQPVLSQAYEIRPPEGIPVSLTYHDTKTKKDVTLNGLLAFDAISVKVDGKNRSFDVKQLVPEKDGDITITRKEQQFTLKHYNGTTDFTFDFELLPVAMTTAAQIDASISGNLPGMEGDVFDDPAAKRFEETVNNRDPAIEKKLEAAPAQLQLNEKPEVDYVAIANIKEIIFKVPPHYRREKPRGRFVQYSKAARGSDGRVQILASTFIGSDRDDQIVEARFLEDGRIIVAGNLAGEPAVGVQQIQRIGNDPDLNELDKKTTNARRPIDPRTTGFVAVFDDKLQTLEKLTRLPWGAVVISDMAFDGQGRTWLTAREGPAFELMEKVARNTTEIPNPAAVAKAKEKKRDPAPDGLVMRLSKDQTSIDLLIIVKHAQPGIARLHNGHILIERGNDLFRVNEQDKVELGPDLDGRLRWRWRSPIIPHPKQDSYYIGGEYHSPTGLEPWRNPVLYKLDKDGKAKWTAWNWTGPVVGVTDLRLVSDSAVRDIRFDKNGDLLIRGWSDGGNSVFLRQPYDLEKPTSKIGFAGTIWGANVLSVTYLIRMDGDTQEVKAFTRWLAYLPLDDKPNSASIKDYDVLDDGRVAMTGGSAFALIETHDAWVTSWWRESQENPYAPPKGGPYFALFSRDFGTLDFSSVIPAIQGQKLDVQGNKVILFGAATASAESYGVERKPLIKNALQTEHAGGKTDGYIMLIDTAGKPSGGEGAKP